jgi:hypothetical protein
MNIAAIPAMMSQVRLLPGDFKKFLLLSDRMFVHRRALRETADATKL